MLTGKDDASLPAFRTAFNDSGFWSDSEGMLLIVDDNDEMLGHIEFFETVSYLDELELSYIIYSSEHMGRGVATEAVRLLTGYLFDRKKHNRIRLIIHPGNQASRRVAEKSGYTFESLSRGAWFHRGRNHDVEVWALLRADHYGN
ncbi:MAG: GNAT family N-acetyltransferase [Jiangellaceae bacterium]